MTMIDGIRDKEPRTILPPQKEVAIAVKAGQIIDLKGYNSATFAVLCGRGDVGSEYDVVIEDGDDPALGDAAVVDEGFLTRNVPLAAFSGIPETAEGSIFAVSYHGFKRYVRISIDVTAANPTEGLSDALNVDVRNVTAESAAIDLGAVHGEVMVLLAVGTITDGTHVISMTHSEDDGVTDPYAPIDAGDIDVALPTLDNTVLAGMSVHRYIGTKRYLKIQTTVTPGVTGGVYGAFVLQMKGGPMFSVIALLEHARHQ
jgi:hypothetical protein